MVSPTEVSTAHTPPMAVTTTLESVTLKPSLMPGATMVSPTEVSTAHTPPMVVTTTLESVTLRPSPMPGATMASPTEVSTAHTAMAVSTTLESVTSRPSPMPGATATVFHTPTEVPVAVTTSESAMPRLSPGAITVSPTEVSTEDGPMSTKEELLSSGLNCDTFKNLPRRIIQLPVLWIPKKLEVQNE